jgi:N utilization substance protein A
MDIDMAALRMLEREKDVPFDLLVRTIEQALLLAYHRTEGAHPHARVVLDRKSGHVVVWAQETDAAGKVVREWDDTPEGFGRIAATTARQTILQRLRDAEMSKLSVSSVDGRATSSPASSSRAATDGACRSGPVEAVALRRAGAREAYTRRRLRCYVVVRKRLKVLDHAVPDSRTWSASCSPSGSRSPTVRWNRALASEAGHLRVAVRSTIAGVNAKGTSSADGAQVRAVAGLHGEDRHHRPQQPRTVAAALSWRWLVEIVDLVAKSARVVVGLPAVAGHRTGGTERAAGGQAHRMADRHPFRHRRRRGTRRAVGRVSCSALGVPCSALRPGTVPATESRPRDRTSSRGTGPGDPGLRPEAVTPGDAGYPAERTDPPLVRGRLTEAGDAVRQSAHVGGSPRGPVRTCVGCRIRAHQSVLLRAVASEYGGIWFAVPDPRRRLGGRVPGASTSLP